MCAAVHAGVYILAPVCTVRGVQWSTVLRPVGQAKTSVPLLSVPVVLRNDHLVEVAPDGLKTHQRNNKLYSVGLIALNQRQCTRSNKHLKRRSVQKQFCDEEKQTAEDVTA